MSAAADLLALAAALAELEAATDQDDPVRLLAARHVVQTLLRRLAGSVGLPPGVTLVPESTH